MRYEIKNRWTGSTIYGDEADSFSALILAAIRAKTDLRSAVLRSADLRSADLRSADLSGAVLSGAVLRSADLRSADLRSADLSGAVLSGAVLRSADLRSADLRSADLSGAVLSGVDLSGADLSGADLSGVDLSGVDLSGAVLSGADLSGVKGLLPIVPEEGSFVGFKKLANGVIAKILIPEDAERIGGYTGRKCRAQKAIVLEGEGFSQHNSKFEYKPGVLVIPDSWDNDPRVECSHGIHFFLTKKEAQEY